MIFDATRGDQPDINATLLCPDQSLDGARTRCEAVSVDEDLRLGAVNRIHRKSRAVLLGRKTHRNCHSGCERDCR
jgi:hypothetical protein